MCARAATRSPAHVRPPVDTAYLPRGQLDVTAEPVLNLGRARRQRSTTQDADGRQLHQDGRHDRAAPRLLVGHEGRRHAPSCSATSGRYFLPVTNVINIKQAGGLLDERTYYAFDGWDERATDQRRHLPCPILGPQIGPVDTRRATARVGDLRTEVDRDMDPVYQDELILGFQQMINDKWSWGVNAHLPQAAQRHGRHGASAPRGRCGGNRLHRLGHGQPRRE